MATIECYAASTVPVLADRVRPVLEESGLIGLPTESFYGLSVAPFDEQALARLWQVIGRTEGKPILVLIGDGSQLGPFVRSIPPSATVLMNAFWSGPLTIVFLAAVGLSDAVTGTSTNRESMLPPRRAEEVQRTHWTRGRSDYRCWTAPRWATVHRHRCAGPDPNHSRWSNRTRCHRGSVGRSRPASQRR